MTDTRDTSNRGIVANDTIERWAMIQLELDGPDDGNPFVDVTLSATFFQGERALKVFGFYDGEGRYKIRFMPDSEGVWTYRTSSNAPSLDSKSGGFTCTPVTSGNHGPVRVSDTFHFAYADGTRYFPVGTTCYAWTHQGDEIEDMTLCTLAESPFNKVRMCVFPKSYEYNANEPVFHPFEGSVEKGWDYTRFNPDFFRHVEQRVADLCKLGIEADLILFHPYDKWGYSTMSRDDDDGYLRYVIARFAALRNVWWSLANEFDLMRTKEEADWERFAGILVQNDSFHHLRSIHNCYAFYDHGRPWITHCSIQRVDVYRTSENTDEWRTKWAKPIVIDECAYEGNINHGWGNITGEEMVRRFWEGAVRGGYVGHGETYLDSQDILWWSKGGTLHGTSPQRIEFLKRMLEETPGPGMNRLNSPWDAPCGGVEGEYYLHYYGFNQPRFREYSMPPDTQYTVEVIDTWNMTVEKLPGTYEGTFRVNLPGRQYMAVRIRRA